MSVKPQEKNGKTLEPYDNQRDRKGGFLAYSVLWRIFRERLLWKSRLLV